MQQLCKLHQISNSNKTRIVTEMLIQAEAISALKAQVSIRAPIQKFILCKK